MHGSDLLLSDSKRIRLKSGTIRQNIGGYPHCNTHRKIAYDTLPNIYTEMDIGLENFQKVWLLKNGQMERNRLNQANLHDHRWLEEC